MQTNLPLNAPNQCDDLPTHLKQLTSCEFDLQTNLLNPKSSFMKTPLLHVRMSVFILVVLLIGIHSVSLSQTTYSWKGNTGSTVWNLASNWTSAANLYFPGEISSSDVVTINTSAPSTYPSIGK